jgi:hypothetical protein
LSYAPWAWPSRAPIHGISAVKRHVSPSLWGRPNMNSWYLPAIPAALALSVIAYSFWVAY